MTPHTKGPWSIRRGHSVVEIRTTAGLPVAQTTAGTYWENFSDESLANARLIAASPDLLAALSALGVVGKGYCFCSHDRDPDKTDHQGECAQARAAIKKAREGERR